MVIDRLKNGHAKITVPFVFRVAVNSKGLAKLPILRGSLTDSEK